MSYRCRPCGAPQGDEPKCEYCKSPNPSYRAPEPTLSHAARVNYEDSLFAARQRNDMEAQAYWQAQLSAQQRGSGGLMGYRAFGGILGFGLAR